MFIIIEFLVVIYKKEYEIKPHFSAPITLRMQLYSNLIKEMEKSELDIKIWRQLFTQTKIIRKTSESLMIMYLLLC
jgi:hypothetical protein